MTDQVPRDASGAPSAAPLEVSALLHADSEAAREAAWTRFLEVHSATLLRVARSFGGDHDACMDRYACSLDRLREDDFRRLRAYLRPGAGPFDLWLIVVVRRLCLDHHRQRYGRSRDSGEDGVQARRARRRLADLVGDRIDPASLASSNGRAPDDVLARAERDRALGLALGRLPPRDRLLLRLRFVEELPVKDIANLLKLPTVFHVYRRLGTVFRAVRETLDGLGVDGSPP